MKAKDPVCGMEIESENAFAKREHEGRTFYFCSQDCAIKFDADPTHTNTVIRRNTSIMAVMAHIIKWQLSVT